MISKNIMGVGAMLLAVLIVMTLTLDLPEKLHYVWALLAFAWGVITLESE